MSLPLLIPPAINLLDYDYFAEVLATPLHLLECLEPCGDSGLRRLPVRLRPPVHSTASDPLPQAPLGCSGVDYATSQAVAAPGAVQSIGNDGADLSHLLRLRLR